MIARATETTFRIASETAGDFDDVAAVLARVRDLGDRHPQCKICASTDLGRSELAARDGCRVQETLKPGQPPAIAEILNRKVARRKQGANGTNVNELTHQQLTDIGRAPCFYDCAVQVERLPG